MCKRRVALLLLVLGVVSTLYVADLAPARGGELTGFEDVKKPKLYFYEKEGHRPGDFLVRDWGYVEPMEANGNPGFAVFHACGANGEETARLAKLTDLREEDDKGDKGDGVCLSNEFAGPGIIDPLGLYIEIYSVKESGPWGATLDTIISLRDIQHYDWSLPDTVRAEEWKRLENNYGGEIPAGTYLGRYAFGHYFLVATSAVDIHFSEQH